LTTSAGRVSSVRYQIISASFATYVSLTCLPATFGLDNTCFMGWSVITIIGTALITSFAAASESVGIKNHLNAVGITAAHIDVNTTLTELVLLVKFKDNMLSSYYCSYGVSTASIKKLLLLKSKISKADPPSTYMRCMKWPPISASMIIGPSVPSSSFRGVVISGGALNLPLSKAKISLGDFVRSVNLSRLLSDLCWNDGVALIISSTEFGKFLWRRLLSSGLVISCMNPEILKLQVIEPHSSRFGECRVKHVAPAVPQFRASGRAADSFISEPFLRAALDAGPFRFPYNISFPCPAVFCTANVGAVGEVPECVLMGAATIIAILHHRSITPSPHHYATISFTPTVDATTVIATSSHHHHNHRHPVTITTSSTTPPAAFTIFISTTAATKQTSFSSPPHHQPPLPTDATTFVSTSSASPPPLHGSAATPNHLTKTTTSSPYF
nr:hypothetical protein [Tanacetum cinerariifolium]